MPKSLMDFVAEARERVKHLSADELEAMRHQRDTLLVVDVREPDEYAAGHLPGALLVPRGTLEGAADPAYKHRNPALCQAHGQPIVVYCQTGGRSAMAADTLQQMGFQEVYNLAGGFENWEAEELPVVAG